MNLWKFQNLKSWFVKIIFTAAFGKKLISFAGSSHNAWHANLSDNSVKKIGCEFATSSVTSSGLEGIFVDNPVLIAGVEQANVALIDDVKYSDVSRRGYVFITLSEIQAKADWRFVSTILEKDFDTTSGHTAIEE